MSDKLCQYGSCASYATGPEEGVGVTGHGYRVRFCSWIHAAMWLFSKVRSADREFYGRIQLYVHAIQDALDEYERELAKAAVEKKNG